MSSLYALVVESLEIEYSGEGLIEFSKKVAHAISKLDDDAWNALHDSIRDWYDSFAASYQGNETNEDWTPPTMDGLQEEIDNFVPVEKPAKEKKAKAPKEPKAPKAPKEPKPPKEKKEAAPSNSGTMREILTGCYDISLEDLMKQLEERGLAAKRSSVHIVWFNTQKTMEALLKAGGFKDKAGNVYKITKE